MRPRRSVNRLPVSAAQMAHQIRPFSPAIAGRLEEVAEAIEHPGGWSWASEIDLYRLCDPREVLAAAERHFRRGHLLIGVLEWLRNILILVPICLTWFALASASENYRRAIPAHSRLGRQPFLPLWPQG